MGYEMFCLSNFALEGRSMRTVFYNNVYNTDAHGSVGNNKASHACKWIPFRLSAPGETCQIVLYRITESAYHRQRVYLKCVWNVRISYYERMIYTYCTM